MGFRTAFLKVRCGRGVAVFVINQLMIDGPLIAHQPPSDCFKLLFKKKEKKTLLFLIHKCTGTNLGPLSASQQSQLTDTGLW